MKNLLLLIISLLYFSCKNGSEPSKKNEIVVEQRTNNESETFTKTIINNKEIKEAYGFFNGEGGSDLTGAISNFTLEIPENIFDKNTHEIKFNHSKKTSPLMLKLGKYYIKGIESDNDYIENNKEDTFYCMDALTMNTYNKMYEELKSLDKEAFLEVLHFDFIVIPDEKNNFVIESIKEIENSKEFIEIYEGKGIRNNKFIIEGKFQVKIMKASSKEEFTIQSQFKTEYDYSYTE